MNKKLNIITSVLFLALIFGFAVCFWVVPDKEFSENENRVLQTFPTLSGENLLEGKLSEDFNAYFTDQFPLRDGMLTISSITHLAMGRGESNGVLVGRGGQLAVRKFDAYLGLTKRAEDTDYYDPAHIENAAQALGRLTQGVDVPVTVLPAPRTLDVAVSAFDYPATLSDELNQALFSALDEAGADALDLTQAFRTMYDAGEYVYYRTDHHWTTLGAYTAYTQLMTAWGMESDILPAEAFTVRTVPDFYGTTWSRAGLSYIPPDTMEIWEREDDSAYTLRDEQGAVITEGFIDESYLDGKDKYGAFLSGTRRVLTVSCESAKAPRPRLLVARDSFASSLAPFLARHFDLVLVNLSGGMTELSAYAEAYDCDRILVVCNLENFVTSDALVRIN